MKKILTNLYMKAKTLRGDLTLSVDEIAQFTGGSVIGDGGVKIKDMSSIAFSKEGDITFATNEEELLSAEKSPATSILTTVRKDSYSKTIILVDDVKRALTMMYNAMLEVKPPEKGSVHPSAVISETAKLGKDVSVGPFAVIEDNVDIGDNVAIGANCFIGKDTVIGDLSRIYPNAVIYHQIVIGKKVIIHSGTVIGSDGFGYISKDDKIYKVPQMGNVIIEDNVEIGANTCIDRGTFKNTVIGKGTKIDNMVQIAHNVKLGKNVLLAGHTGIAGSTTIGDKTMMGGGVGVSDNIVVGKNVKIGGKAGVIRNVDDGKTVFGYPAREASDFKKLYGLSSLFLKNIKKIRTLIRNLPDDQ